MAINTKPPANSARLPNNTPKALPAVSPTATITVVAIPMIAAAKAMFTSINAKPTPTIMESILVPKAVKTVIHRLSRLLSRTSSALPDSPSRIIFRPSPPSRTKAAQWSHSLINGLA
ncbi:Uncharacterised protein [Neisseria meningitidis]|nr:Uncharacterised protein [Neisseria meningitidis]